MHYKHAVLMVEARKRLAERLLEALRAENEVGRVVSHSNLTISLEMLRNSLPTSIVFVADDFPDREILHFLAGAKVAPSGRDAAFILIMQYHDANIGSIAKNLLGGMDGFIAAPFSLEAVQRVVVLADSVRRQNIRRRIEAICKLALEATSREINNVFIDLKFGRKRGFGNDILASMQTLKGLSAVELEVYFEILCEVFENAPPLPAFVVDRIIGDANAEAGTLEAEAEAAPELVKLIEDLASTNWKVRADAAAQIANLGSRAKCCVPFLIPMLQDSMPLCRQRATRALLKVDTPEAQSALSSVKR